MRLVHHVNTPMRLSTTAPDVEYASRNGKLMLSINLVYVAVSRRVSSSRGKALENLVSADVKRGGQRLDSLADVTEAPFTVDAHNLLWQITAYDARGRLTIVCRVGQAWLGD